MKSTRVAVWCVVVSCLIVLCGMTYPALADELATISGRITDPQGLVVAGVKVEATNINTNIVYSGESNADGLYRIPSIPPGAYRVIVQKTGFAQILKPGVELHVQDIIALNFTMQLGSVTETVTVEAGAPVINTESATVSTVVNRNFAENLPLNGRSFQTLIQLTPGVVLTANNGFDTGQFSVNGQRPSSNYWMVDGVGANIGIGTFATPGNGLGGALGSSSVLGGTNSLVSVDALQEFRIQTSTYAPEFGRTPGAQISILTRSGTNQFHGTAFDYLRNDVFDANDWFANFTKQPKAEERQNDFGGTFAGPILKGKTFFFFSYEGLRLRLPQTTLTTVPDASFTPGGTTDSRENAMPAIQPFLNAFPLPNSNSPEIFVPCDPATDPTCPPSGQKATGSADFNASYSNRATLDAYSIRLDHKLNDKINLFGRYNYSPSKLDERGGGALSDAFSSDITTKTGTVGMTGSLSPLAVNDFRFNYSSTDSSSRLDLDNFRGAVPLATLPFPGSFTTRNAKFAFEIFSLGSHPGIAEGANTRNRQRQINLVDSLSMQKGLHALKFGVDYRRLSPEYHPNSYFQETAFLDVPSAETGSTLFNFLTSSLPVTVLFRALGIFAQDTWRVVPRLTLTYGLRWDLDFVPSSLRGPSFNAVTGFDVSDLSSLALAPAGTTPYKTKDGNIAPRIGLAYQLSQRQDWQTVLRGGFGVFYDLATSEAGNILVASAYPFGAFSAPLSNFPLTAQAAAPPPIVPPTASNFGVLYAFDPHLQLPYTLEWNVALEQALGKQQTLSASYIGSAGRRLIQTGFILSPNPNFFATQLVTNAGTSDYNALQIQFQRRLSQGLQALASYTWSHSIDTASAGSLGNQSNALSALNSNVNRGPSDFDIRHTFSMALSYDVPAPKANVLAKAILGGWSTENVVQARSAPPVDIFYSGFGLLSSGFATNVRPDALAGQPFYLYGSQYPGGKALNPAAFTSPALDPTSNLPTRQGDLSRNALRGFGATQWDFAIHRDFPIHESVKLQFRAELFNVLNHPNFGQPVADLGAPGVPNPQFGRSMQMLGQSLAGGNLGGGAFDPLYQLGGPRSVQFALKLSF